MQALRRPGLQPRIRPTLPHFTVAPPVVVATDLAAVMPLRPALRLAPVEAKPRRRLATTPKSRGVR